MITLDIPKREFSVNLTDAELEARRQTWTPPAPHYSRGFGKLYLDHVTQAEEGSDFDFLHGKPGTTAEPEIH